MTDTINIQHYYQLRCPVPQSPKLYGLLNLHKMNIQAVELAMQAIVLFCGSLTHQLSRQISNSTLLHPLTDKSRHKLQFNENFIDIHFTEEIG